MSNYVIGRSFSGFTQVALLESWPIDVYDPNTKVSVCNSSNSIQKKSYSSSGSSETFTFCHTIGPDLVLNTDKYLSLVLVVFIRVMPLE